MKNHDPLPTDPASIGRDADEWPLVHILCALFVPVVLLLPFANRAFHVDDPFYVWVAQQIVKTPMDFYGFSVNWNGILEPVHEINKNPPGVSYFIAAIGALFGWGERPMHLVFLVPTALASLGIYGIAARWTRKPLLALLAAIFSPVFLLSASNVMAETTMFAFYVWSLYCWIVGFEEGRARWLFVAGLLAGLSVLTKYFGISLLPLMFVFGMMKHPKPGLWMLALLVPVTMIGGYELYTAHLYGEGHLFDAILFAEDAQTDLIRIAPALRMVTGLSFLGGCLFPIVALSPFLWNLRSVLAGAVAAVVLGIVLYAGLLDDFFVIEPTLGSTRPIYAAQMALFVVGGLSILALAVRDLWRERDASSLLLGLWLMGTFLFAVRFNWAINGRSLLPAAAPAAILAARVLDHRATPVRISWLPYAILAPALAVALSAVWGDFKQANTTRKSAVYIAQNFSDRSRTVWYQGHWGFQYYMEAIGGKHTDMDLMYVNAGDVLVSPFFATQTYNLNPVLVRSQWVIDIYASRWITTWNPEIGAGYYSDSWGPLPFVFGRIPPEEVNVVTLGFTGPISVGGSDEAG